MELTFAEQMIIASDRRRARLLVAAVAEFDGRLDAGALRAAADAVCQRRPALTRALADRFGAAGWRLEADPAGPVELIEVTASGDGYWPAVDELLSGEFDPRRAPAIRMLLAHRPDGDAVALAAHHVIVDGRSVVALLAEILEAVGAAGTADAPAAARPPAAARSPLGQVVGAAARRAVGGAWRGARGALLARARVGARHVAPTGRPGTTGYLVAPLVLSVPATRPACADGGRPTVNDMLLAAAHLAVERWSAGRGRACGVLRVRMPAVTGGADQGGDGSELGNNTGQSLIFSRPADRADPATLLDRVREQSARIKAADVRTAAGASGAVAAVAAAVLRGWPRALLLRAAVEAARPALAPAAAVSNVGRVAPMAAGAAGPATRAVYFAATAGPPQGLMIGVTRTGERLHLTFCFHRAVADRVGAAAFAELFAAAFAEVAGRPEALAA
ncbi:MAG: hypothetical protein IRZ08_09715 [Frankia sp.]|nr:hypothetical protein [Frankia sp.]